MTEKPNPEVQKVLDEFARERGLPMPPPNDLSVQLATLSFEAGVKHASKSDAFLEKEKHIAHTRGIEQGKLELAKEVIALYENEEFDEYEMEDDEYCWVGEAKAETIIEWLKSQIKNSLVVFHANTRIRTYNKTGKPKRRFASQSWELDEKRRAIR